MIKLISYLVIVGASTAAFAAELYISKVMGSGTQGMNAEQIRMGSSMAANLAPGNEKMAKFLSDFPENTGISCDAVFYTINEIHYLYDIVKCSKK